MSTVRSQQQRRYRRRTVRVAVDYHSYMGSARATATTLGAGGMFIATDDALPAHTKLDVRFSLPHGSGRVYEMSATVVWSNGADDEEEVRALGMGISFDDPSACVALAADLDEHEPPEAPPA